MTTDKIAQNMEVIGADGVHVGTTASPTVASGSRSATAAGPAQGPRAFHRPSTCRRRRGAEDSPFCERGCGRNQGLFLSMSAQALCARQPDRPERCRHSRVQGRCRRSIGMGTRAERRLYTRRSRDWRPARSLRLQTESRRARARAHQGARLRPSMGCYSINDGYYRRSHGWPGRCWITKPASRS